MSTSPSKGLPIHDASLSEMESVLAWHDGDAKAAVATLLDDCRFLRQQLALTEGASSCGFTRGWTLAYDRHDR